MSNPKEEVMKLIAKKRRASAANRARSARQMGVHAIVLEFIKNMEKTISESKNAMEFQDGLDAAARLLDSRMRSIDPEVHLQIKWNNEFDTDKWQDLQVEGVHIRWSSFYLGKHPFESPERLVDAGSLFIEGLLD